MTGERLNAERRCIAVRNADVRVNLRFNAIALALSVTLAGVAGTALPATAQAQTAPAQQQFSIPAGTLREALDALASQSGITVMYSPELVTGKTSRGLSGRFNATEALRRLLTGSGLEAQDAGDSTFTLKRTSAPNTEHPAQTRSLPTTAQSAEPEVKDLEKMTVTGTRIRGAQPSSPLVMITQEDMRLAGHNNLGDVIRALPQNFSGGQNPGVLIGAGGGVANQNITGGSSLNLRGLGPDATLTLLNGARLAYDGFTQATDVAVIPVAAIDRMEVLLDGASALYGSDAVGGVANIILKRDYDGAELTTRYGRATDGGYEQTQVSAVVGETWTTGGLLIAGETTSSSDVLAAQRDYLSYISDPDLLTIYPKTSQDGVLVSGHQELGSRTELLLDAFYTKRSARSKYLYPPLFVQYEPSTSVYGISPSIRFALPHDWSLRLNGFLGEDETRTHQLAYTLATGALASNSRTMYRNRTQAAGVELEGAIFTLPGGDARVSFGGGLRKTELKQANLVSRAVAIGGENSSHYAYGEINVPLVQASQNISFVNQLAINGAVRYESYDSFGGTTTPKFGVTWAVTQDLDIRASWGKSFKAPTITQQYQGKGLSLRTAQSFGIADAPADATVLYGTGGNQDLAPERAEVVTAGFVFRPSFAPGASIELGWFDIDYTQRIVNPFTFTAFTQYGPALEDPTYTRFITQNPSASQQQELVQVASTFTNLAGVAYDPAQVVAFFDNSYTNASSQRVRGVDLDLRYVVPAGDGMWSFNAGASWITDSQRRIVDGTPEFDTAGVVNYPPKFKGRLGASWSRSNFSVTGTVNHLSGVWNTALMPNIKGDSMTTMDVVFDYAADPGLLGGFGFNASITNVFNRRPPYLAPPQPIYVAYDSTNYSALGRVISVSVTKRF